MCERGRPNCQPIETCDRFSQLIRTRQLAAATDTGLDSLPTADGCHSLLLSNFFSSFLSGDSKINLQNSAKSILFLYFLNWRFSCWKQRITGALQQFSTLVLLVRVSETFMTLHQLGIVGLLDFTALSLNKCLTDCCLRLLANIGPNISETWSGVQGLRQ